MIVVLISVFWAFKPFYGDLNSPSRPRQIKDASMQVYKYASMWVCKYASMHVNKYASSLKNHPFWRAEASLTLRWFNQLLNKLRSDKHTACLPEDRRFEDWFDLFPPSVWAFFLSRLLQEMLSLSHNEQRSLLVVELLSWAAIYTWCNCNQDTVLLNQIMPSERSRDLIFWQKLQN